VENLNLAAIAMDGDRIEARTVAHRLSSVCSQLETYLSHDMISCITQNSVSIRESESFAKKVTAEMAMVDESAGLFERYRMLSKRWEMIQKIPPAPVAPSPPAPGRGGDEDEKARRYDAIGDLIDEFAGIFAKPNDQLFE
jgi:hypothetical protein